MKLKKWLALGLSLALAGSVFSLVACDGDGPDTPGPGGDTPGTTLDDDSDRATPGLKFTEVLEGGSLVGYSVGVGTAYDQPTLYIPQVWEGKPVVSVGVEPETFARMLQQSGFDTMPDDQKKDFMRQYAIAYSSVSEIHLPETLKYFGYCAFLECIALEEIEIPKGIKSIYDCTFMYDIALENVTFASNDNLRYIGAWAFYDCTQLKSMTLPDSVEEIDIQAFAMSGNLTAYGSGLESIDLGEGVTTLGYQAFYRSGLKSIVIPDSVELIGLDDDELALTFAECPLLEEVTIGSGMKIIPKQMFYSCVNLKKVTFTETKIIEYQAFFGCVELVDIDFGESLEEIGSGAFWACQKLAKVVLPDSIQIVGSAAFQACSALDELWLGKSIWSIEKDAFTKGMGTLPSKIYYTGTRPQYNSVEGEGKPNGAQVICSDEAGYVAP